jgi:very-short-patch-repair endonuclease
VVERASFRLGIRSPAGREAGGVFSCLSPDRRAAAGREGEGRERAGVEDAVARRWVDVHPAAVARVRTVRRAKTVARARRLRADQTPAEARLWGILRAGRLGGWVWRRQAPWGPYFLDFLCRDARLVVEVDGGQHTDRATYDAARTSYLEESGLRVLRFWNTEVLENLDGVALSILAGCGGERGAGDRGGERGGTSP